VPHARGWEHACICLDSVVVKSPDGLEW